MKYPGTKYSIVRTFDNLRPILKEKYAGGKIGACKTCKEPTSNDLCKSCILKEKLGLSNS